MRAIRRLSSVVGRASPPKKKRLVILGTGWGGYRAALNVDKSKYDVTILSPRNHFLFTPLLAGTTTGTLEFRTVTESIRKSVPQASFYLAEAESIDLEQKRVYSRSVFPPDIDTNQTPVLAKYDSSIDPNDLDKTTDRTHDRFWVSYDELLIAVGALNNTFNIPGADPSNVFFLKELAHARKIRQRILHCFERAAEPGTSESIKETLLHFVVVGGGPTGVEFAGELYDFIKSDVQKAYSQLYGYVKVTLVEGGDTVLSSFDQKLGSYAVSQLKKHGVRLMTDTRVVGVEPGMLKLQFGKHGPQIAQQLEHTTQQEVVKTVPETVESDTLKFGMCVWSTGIAVRGFVKELKGCQKDRGGRIVVDEYLRLRVEKPGGSTEEWESLKDVYAIGDCATLMSKPLAATAQVANQQGKYVARYLNAKIAAEEEGKELSITPFKFMNMGALAYLGGYHAVSDLPGVRVWGLLSWIVWRSAYLSNLMSWSNRMLVVMHWFKSFVFGRDVSWF